VIALQPVEANLRILGILSGRIPALLPDPLAEELDFDQLSENEYMKDYWDTTPIWFKKVTCFIHFWFHLYRLLRVFACLIPVLC